MAKIIDFYVPSSFRKKATRWIPPEQRGKVIPFGARVSTGVKWRELLFGEAVSGDKDAVAAVE